MTQKLGIEVEIFMLYALPLQTYEDALETIEFVQHLGIELLGNSSGQQLALFFGTDMTLFPEKYGLRVNQGKRPRYLSLGTEFETDCMSAEEMERIRELLRGERLLAYVNRQSFGQLLF